MRLIQALREATSLGEVEPILQRLNMSTTARKLAEVSIMTRQNPNPQAQAYADQMMAHVIREAEEKMEHDDDEHHEKEAHDEHKEREVGLHDDGVKPKKDHFVKEEELDNHNPETGNKGSDQSSDNTPPYPQEGDDAPNSDIESMQTSSFTKWSLFGIYCGWVPRLAVRSPIVVVVSFSGFLPADMDLKLVVAVIAARASVSRICFESLEIA